MPVCSRAKTYTAWTAFLRCHNTARAATQRLSTVLLHKDPGCNFVTQPPHTVHRHILKGDGDVAIYPLSVSAHQTRPSKPYQTTGWEGCAREDRHDFHSSPNPNKQAIIIRVKSENKSWHTRCRTREGSWNSSYVQLNRCDNNFTGLFSSSCVIEMRASCKRHPACLIQLTF